MRTSVRSYTSIVFLSSVLALSVVCSGGNEPNLAEIPKVCRPLENALQQVTEALFFWQKMSIAGGIAAPILLLIGAGPGSRARKDAMKQRTGGDHGSLSML